MMELKGFIVMVLKRFHSDGTKKFLKSSSMMEPKKLYNDGTKKFRKAP